MLKLNEIMQGHVLDVAPTIPDENVSCIITSPPYWVKRDYKDKGKSLNTIWLDGWKGQLGQEPTVDMYIRHLMQIFDMMHNVLRNDGNLFVVIGDTRSRGGRPKKANWQDSLRSEGNDSTEPDIKPQYSMPDKSQCCVPEFFKLAMINSGWIARSTYIWVKTNPKTESVKDRFTDCHEYVYHFVKQKKYYFDTQYEPCVTKPHRPNWAADVMENNDRRANGENKIWAANGLRQKRGAFVGPIQPFKGAHFATYPTWLIKPLIEASCPKMVCKTCGEIAKPVYDKHVDLRERLNDITESCTDAGPSANSYAGLRRKLIKYDKCKCGKGLHSKAFTSGVVFDPFMGVGTTAVVADELGLDWSGIELSKQYIKMSYLRLHKERQRRS